MPRIGEDEYDVATERSVIASLMIRRGEAEAMICGTVGYDFSVGAFACSATSHASGTTVTGGTVPGTTTVAPAAGRRMQAQPSISSGRWSMNHSSRRLKAGSLARSSSPTSHSDAQEISRRRSLPPTIEPR